MKLANAHNRSGGQKTKNQLSLLGGERDVRSRTGLQRAKEEEIVEELEVCLYDCLVTSIVGVKLVFCAIAGAPEFFEGFLLESI